MSWVLREIVSFSWDSFFQFQKTRLLIKVDDKYIIQIIAMTIDSFNFFLLRQQSGRVKRHAYSYVFLLRPPLPKARSRGGRQFLGGKSFDIVVWNNIDGTQNFDISWKSAFEVAKPTIENRKYHENLID